MSAAIKTWQDRMTESGRRECESLAVELMQGEIDDLRAALDNHDFDAPQGPTIAELQSAGYLSAFPQSARAGDLAVSEGGMTLRDYFAAKALQGMLSQDGMTLDIDGSHIGIQRANTAYAIADAMLAARGAA